MFLILETLEGGTLQSGTCEGGILLWVCAVVALAAKAAQLFTCCLRVQSFGSEDRSRSTLSGPLDRLNAILSLLQPLDRYRAPSAIGTAIGRHDLALSRFHAQVGALNRLVLNRFRGSTAR